MKLIVITRILECTIMYSICEHVSVDLHTGLIVSVQCVCIAHCTQ